MSVRVMGAVFELDTPATEKLVLLAMADHARDDGTGCYPSIATLAKKTSLTKRGTQIIVHRLRDAGFIRDTGKISEYQTIEYAITLGKGGERGSLPFKAKGANATAGPSERESAQGANATAGKGRTVFARIKSGNKNLSGGGDDKAAAAFLAFGFDGPFGHRQFKTALIRRAEDLADGEVLKGMELVIQDCNCKVPPQFYRRKRELEEEIRNAPARAEARVGSYHQVEQHSSDESQTENGVSMPELVRQAQAEHRRTGRPTDDILGELKKQHTPQFAEVAL